MKCIVLCGYETWSLVPREERAVKNAGRMYSYEFRREDSVEWRKLRKILNPEHTIVMIVEYIEEK
jgi:hypothetical protein